jgi:hypothetical protein
MDRAWRQPLRKPANGAVGWSQHDLENGGVVREHGDDDPAPEEWGDFGRGFQAKRGELVCLIPVANIGYDPMAGASQVRGHRGAHAAKTDEADLRRS